jgi:hypothetical protein
MSPETSSDSPAGLRVGYVLTHYPRLAQTFIARKSPRSSACGVHVAPFAMNTPAPSEQRPPGAAQRMARTTYLKPQLARALVALAGQLLRRTHRRGR